MTNQPSLDWEVKLLDELGVPMCDGKHKRMGCEREIMLYAISQAKAQGAEEERERIVNEVEKLKRYNAAINGIPAAYMTDDWYNQALRDVVDLLSSNQKK